MILTTIVKAHALEKFFIDYKQVMIHRDCAFGLLSCAMIMPFLSNPIPNNVLIAKVIRSDFG